MKILQCLAAATKGFSWEIKFLKMSNILIDNNKSKQKPSKMFVQEHIFGKAAEADERSGRVTEKRMYFCEQFDSYQNGYSRIKYCRCCSSNPKSQ